MSVLAIDPGTTESAYAHHDPRTGRVESQTLPNDVLLGMLRGWRVLDLEVVIEKVESYGMPVGAEVFETVRWAGRFEEALHPVAVSWLPRRVVKLVLCGSARATDATIRQALIDRFGGKDAAVGRKSAPGPLHGVHGDEWAALAVAVAWSDPLRRDWMR